MLRERERVQKTVFILEHIPVDIGCVRVISFEKSKRTEQKNLTKSLESGNLWMRVATHVYVISNRLLKTN